MLHMNLTQPPFSCCSTSAGQTCSTSTCSRSDLQQVPSFVSNICNKLQHLHISLQTLQCSPGNHDAGFLIQILTWLGRTDLKRPLKLGLRA